jgi:hypothetical protein
MFIGNTVFGIFKASETTWILEIRIWVLCGINTLNATFNPEVFRLK